MRGDGENHPKERQSHKQQGDLEGVVDKYEDV